MSPELYFDMFVGDDAKWIINLGIEENKNNFAKVMELKVALVRILAKEKNYPVLLPTIHQILSDPRIEEFQ